ncbi:hypothetical protein H0H81_005293, partial [Sphagnurus paluster]
MGKEAISILTNIFERDEMSKDEIIDWAKERRGGPIDTFRWLYADPDGPEGEKGAFLSDILLQIFGYHHKQVSGAKKDYGLPIGGLALCTPAMECAALELWSTGELPKPSRKRDSYDPMVLESSSSKKASPAMVSRGNDWVARTAGYTALTKGLDPVEHWLLIFELAETEVALISTTLPEPDAMQARANLSL